MSVICTVTLYEQRNKNGEIEMTILTIIVHVSDLRCYFISMEKQEQ